jgi:hypothetical protein
MFIRRMISCRNVSELADPLGDLPDLFRHDCTLS